MTPDAKMQIFAIKRGLINQRLNVNYYLPCYQNIIEKLKSANRDRLHRISDFANVVCGPFGSAIKNDDYLPDGVPLLRITNISPNGVLDYSDLKFISKELSDKLCNTQVSCGDIVISQRGSLGLCAIVDSTYKTLNISANLIAIKNTKGHSSEFVKNYLNSSVCKDFLAKAQSGQIQSKINTSDIAAILVPFGLNEDRLNSIILNGYKKYISKKQQADELLAGMDNFVFNALQISAKNTTNKLGFAVYLKEMNGVIDVKRRLNTNQIESRIKVQDVANIVKHKINPQKYPEVVFDWIRIDDLPNQPTDITETRTERGDAIDGTFFEVQTGDILVARLGPTILNRKTVMVRTIQRRTIASAEFLVLRCKDGYLPEAVMAVLKTQFFVDQMHAHARGSTPSRYRLNREDMLNLVFPDITNTQLQQSIAQEAVSRRSKALDLRNSAEKDWQNAREQFEKELLGE